MNVLTVVVFSHTTEPMHAGVGFGIVEETGGALSYGTSGSQRDQRLIHLSTHSYHTTTAVERLAFLRRQANDLDRGAYCEASLSRRSVRNKLEVVGAENLKSRTVQINLKTVIRLRFVAGTI